jgi:hypothetical protein
MKAMALLFIGMWVASTAFADDKEVQKYRNYTPQQLERLDEKVQNSEVPMMLSLQPEKDCRREQSLILPWILMCSCTQESMITLLL